MTYNEVLVFSYPKAKLVGRPGYLPKYTLGLCSDSSGDVFITTYGTQSLKSPMYEYAHAGSMPNRNASRSRYTLGLRS